MGRVRVFSAAATAAACLASVASAQDYSLEPTFGSVSLEAGFAPDPHTVTLGSGGSIDASSLGNDCNGYIADAPDYRLHYSGGSLPLIFSVDSDADTTLVVNAPDGSWHCDDDGGNQSLNPMVRFEKPESGRYDIWVGTYGDSSVEAAVLHVSELNSR